MKFHFANLTNATNLLGVGRKKSRKARASTLPAGPGAMINHAIERGIAQKLLERGDAATKVAKKTKLPYCNVAAMARSFRPQAKGRKPDRSILHSQSIGALEVLLNYRNEETAHWWNVETASAALGTAFKKSFTKRITRIFLGWCGIAEDSTRAVIEDALEKARWRAIEDASRELGKIEGWTIHPEGLSALKKKLERYKAPVRSTKYLACYKLAENPTRHGWPTIRVFATRGLQGYGKSEFFRVTLADDSPSLESLPQWGGRAPVKVFSNVRLSPYTDGDAEQGPPRLVHLADANRLILSDAEEPESDMGFLLDPF